MPSSAPSRTVRLLLAVATGACAAACASGGTSPSGGRFLVPGDVASAVNAVVASAPACGLKLVDARRDEAGRAAFLVLLDGAGDPKPENAVVTLRLETDPAGVAATLETQPLAEYGLRPPQVREGGEASACKPCSDARAAFPTYRYSRGLAFGNAARATRCVREALGAGGS